MDLHPLQRIALATFILLCAHLPASADTPAPAQAVVEPAEAGDAERLFEAHRASVAQVRLIDTSGGAKSSIGSGWLLGDEGILISNYHVVSGLVLHPDRFRAEYHFEDGRSGALELLAVDVVHDLAALRLPESGPGLKLRNGRPRKGERIFALGNPHDLGLTIVEGTYNGLLENSLHERIHFTGSLNPGMSGGPAFDVRGRVIGVNVATMGNQLSFLVPARYVIGVGEAARAEPGQFARQMTAQLLDNQRQAVEALDPGKLNTVGLGRFSVPSELAGFLNCWSNSDRQPRQRYRSVQSVCNSQDDIYIDENLSTGSVQFSHELYTTEELGALRFYRMLEARLNAAWTRGGGDEESMGNYECRAGLLGDGMLPLKTVVCVRPYLKLKGLYDVYQTAVSLVDEREALRSTLLLTGVELERGLGFAQRFFESITWNQ